MLSAVPRSTLFDRLGLRVDDAEFEGLVDQALLEFLPQRLDISNRTALSEREASALEEVGLSFERRAAGAEAPLVRTAAEYAAVLASALTVAQAAERLGVESSRVRQRLGDHTLYGIKLRSSWRLPLFQFAARGTLPAFEVLAPHLFGLHPVVVARWFTSPHPDLVVGDEEHPVSPRDWLETGRAPDRVAALAGELHGHG